MKTIIFAPHIDDEVIGCHTLLSEGRISDVYYFFELTDGRQFEALNSARFYGFTPHFVTSIDKFESDFKSTFDRTMTILVPHIRDHHPAHQVINRLARYHHSNLVFYSVDMNDGALPTPLSLQKKSDLYRLFPSQNDYFNQNSACYLFEKIVPSDLKEFMIIRDKIKSGGYNLSYEVKIETGIHLDLVDSLFRDELYKTVYLYRNWKTSTYLAHKVFDWVFRYFYEIKSERYFEVKVSIDDHVFTELKYGE